MEDGPNPIYENLDFIHQKQREDHQRERLRELDQIHYTTLEPPQVPPRQRRPLSGMPPAMSIIPNGDSEVIEEGQLDLIEDGSQENLNKSFDSDGKLHTMYLTSSRKELVIIHDHKRAL